MNDLSLPVELLSTVTRLRERKTEFAERVAVLDGQYADLATRQRAIEAMQQEAAHASQQVARGIRDVVGLPNKSVREAKRRELELFDLIQELRLVLEEETLVTHLAHAELALARKALVRNLHEAECTMWKQSIEASLDDRQPVAALLARIHAYTSDPERMFVELTKKHFPTLWDLFGVQIDEHGHECIPKKVSAFLHELWKFLPEVPPLDPDSDTGVLCWPPAFIQHPDPFDEQQPLIRRRQIESAQKRLSELNQRYQG